MVRKRAGEKSETCGGRTIWHQAHPRDTSRATQQALKDSCHSCSQLFYLHQWPCHDPWCTPKADGKDPKDLEGNINGRQAPCALVASWITRLQAASCLLAQSGQRHHEAARRGAAGSKGAEGQHGTTYAHQIRRGSIFVYHSLSKVTRCICICIPASIAYSWKTFATSVWLHSPGSRADCQRISAVLSRLGAVPRIGTNAGLPVGDSYVDRADRWSVWALLQGLAELHVGVDVGEHGS